jgi:hypothetical protein
MTDPEYEQLKKHLEEQRRIGIDLVERAYEAQVRALEMVRTLQGGTGPMALPAQAPPPGPERPRHRTATEVTSDIVKIYGSLPERFSRREICEALGYEPDRGVLYKALQELVKLNYTVVETKGQGQIATIYHKTPD